MDILNDIAKKLEQGNCEMVSQLTKDAVSQKIPPKTILDKGLITGMNVVGQKYKAHEIFLPDVLFAAKAMYAGMDILKPLFLENKVPTRGKIVIGTVMGDLHDIGKNLVTIMLKGAGFEIIDLGNNVSPEQFVEVAKKENASVIGLSTLLTTTMPVMKKVVDIVKDSELAGKIKIIIGGAPVSDEFANQIGAYAYCYDSTSAVETVKKIMVKNGKM